MRRSGFIGLGLLLGVTVVLGTFAWRWTQRGPGRASVSGAIDRFRTSSTVGTATRPLVPRPGVYLYKGAGTESLSFLGTRQTQGPIEPGTIVLRPNGCWKFRIDFNSFHDQTWDRCATSQTLVESGGTADQRFDFVTFKMGDHSRIRCNPPTVVVKRGAAPGASAPVHCSGHSQTTGQTFTQSGTATFVGRDVVRVGSVSVPGLHVREAMRLSGGQTGDLRVDIWFASTNGLPLKETHRIRVLSPAPAPLGHVTYVERGSWHLTSMTPRG